MNSTPKQIGPFQIREECGSGGMSTVYRAYDTLHEREVALKVLLPQLSSDRTAVRRFEQEGQSTQRFIHPHIVQLYEAGQSDGIHYIAMAYIHGLTLAEHLKRQRGQQLTLAESVAILEQVAAALDYAHAQGVLHRDLKPSNILLSNSGEVWLSDFGAALLLGDEHTMFTTTGFTIGTPYYMSPEQARGDRQLDRRTDVYSLGVIAYLMLTGNLPFVADDPLVLLRKIIDEPAPAPESFNPALPANVAYVLRRALTKEPTRRFSTAGAFVAELERCLATPESEPTVRVERTGVLPVSKPAPATPRRPTTRFQPVLWVLATALIVSGFWWLLTTENLVGGASRSQNSLPTAAVAAQVALASAPPPTLAVAALAPLSSTLDLNAPTNETMTEPAIPTVTPSASPTLQPIVTLSSAGNTGVLSAVVITPTATLLQNVQAIATNTPTSALTPSTSTPDMSKAPTSTPIPDNTDTPTPTATPTAAPAMATPLRPTALPKATPVSKAASAVTSGCPVASCVASLMTPADGDSSFGKVEFRWQPSFTPGPGQAFEVVFWQAGQDPLRDGRGWGGTSATATKVIDCGTIPPGEYFWGVLLVKASPSYEKLLYLGQSRRFVVQAAPGKGSGSSGGNNRGNNGGDNNGPRG